MEWDLEKKSLNSKECFVKTYIIGKYFATNVLSWLEVILVMALMKRGENPKQIMINETLKKYFMSIALKIFIKHGNDFSISLNRQENIILFSFDGLLRC